VRNHGTESGAKRRPASAGSLDACLCLRRRDGSLPALRTAAACGACVEALDQLIADAEAA